MQADPATGATDLSVLQPMLALVALHLAVLIRMYFARIGEMNRERVHPEQLRLRADSAKRLRDTRAADHYANLAELPLLFYPAVMLIWLLGFTDPIYLALAWGFVAARLVHAVIHLSVNRVLWRFLTFIFGAGLLAVLWSRLAIQMLNI